MGIIKKNKNDNEGTETKEQTEKEERRKKKSPLRIVIPVLLLIACGAGACYIFYVHPQMKTKVPAMVENLMNTPGVQETDVSREAEADQTADAAGSAQTVQQDGGAEAGGNVQPQEQGGAEEAQTGKEQAAVDSLIPEQWQDSALGVTGDLAGMSGGKEEKIPEPDADGEKIEITLPEIDDETICGADGPFLDYADEKILVFHDYYGLFLYDWQQSEMIGEVGLEAIGCQYTQGDSTCDVIVEKGGGTVYLHPLDSDDMYVYRTEAKTLTKKPYSADILKKRQKMQLTGEEAQPDPTVFRTLQCAVLENGVCLYLESGSGLVQDLFYVVEKAGERQNTEYLFDIQGVADAAAADEDFGGNPEESPAADSQEGARQAAEAESGETGMEAGDDTFRIEASVVSDYSEEEFKELCRQVDYRKLLREQEVYHNSAVTAELTVLEQIDGGLFDDHIYYLCTAQDSRGFERYYVLRDDRGEDAPLILEGDGLRVYGLFFDTCKCPAAYSTVRMEIPAFAMAYCELEEEY